MRSKKKGLSFVFFNAREHRYLFGLFTFAFFMPLNRLNKINKESCKLSARHEIPNLQTLSASILYQRCMHTHTFVRRILACPQYTRAHIVGPFGKSEQSNSRLFQTSSLVKPRERERAAERARERSS
jgi:hypothetical protein